MRRVFLCSCIVALQTSLAAASEPKWQTQVDIQGKFSGRDAIGEIDVLAPVWQNDRSLLFINFRGQFDDASNQEGSVGVAYRRMLSNGFNVGAYAFADIRNTKFDNTFVQSTVGAEVLGRDIEIRVNGYLPIDNDPKVAFVNITSETESVVDNAVTTIGIARAEVQNGLLAILRDQTTVTNLTDFTTITNTIFSERSLSGGDAEVGLRLPFSDAEDNIQFRLYGGGFYFSAEGVEDVAGPRARAELRIHDVFGVNGARFSVGGEFRHDNVRGSQGYGGARLRFPLQFGKAQKRLTAMERRMLDPIVRDPDVVTNLVQAPTVAVDNMMANRVEEEVVVLSEQAVHAGNGLTVGNVINIDATDDFAAAAQAAGENALVVVDGSAGDIITNAALLPGQTIVGGNVALDFVGATSGAQASLVIDTLLPSFRSATGQEILTVASGTTIRGLTFDASNGFPIYSNVPASQITISDNVFRDLGFSFAILLSSPASPVAEYSNILIKNNMILAANSGLAAGTGISIRRKANNVVIRNNIVSGAIEVWDGSNVLIEDNQIASEFIGLALTGGAQNITIRNNVIDGPAFDAGLLLASGPYDNILVTDNRFVNVSGPQIKVVAAPVDNVTVNNNAFVGVASLFALFELSPGSYTGSGNTLAAGATLTFTCTENGLAAGYTGAGFSFVSSEVCGDGP